jgi:anhydro-N-acetylmuramic acid kinase
MSPTYFIGLMSGTSLDGIDAVLVNFTPTPHQVDNYFIAYPESIKQAILKLQHADHNELETTALLSNQLALLYAQATNTLLHKNDLSNQSITAIGCHGQTIRHQPKFNDGIGFTIQIGNAALLSEKTGITVVSDFRSRDIAAGGQGAPLIPAFHQALFSAPDLTRAIVNIGGIANISYLPKDSKNKTSSVLGFDSGPGNMLIDGWVKRHLNRNFDKNGEWAKTGELIEPLLASMLNESFFSLPPPKSTGRDLFHMQWLDNHLKGTVYRNNDVAYTLTMLTAQSIIMAITNHLNIVDEIYLCGGGAHNTLLNEMLIDLLKQNNLQATIDKTDRLNANVDWVEAFGFAWLAKKCLDKETSSLPSVTGSSGPRILGTITQA